MKISIYSHGWNLVKYNFDYKDAIANWSLYADEIIIAINTSVDSTYEDIRDFVAKNNFPVKLIQTNIDFLSDSFAYGKVVDSALQACSGDLLIQQDMDERIRLNPDFLKWAREILVQNNAKAFFVPTIDLYGDVNKYCHIGKKWYIHLPGLKRGPVSFGIKENGRPDYNKTSSDELIDYNNQLVPTINLWDGDINDLQKYVQEGYPIVYHLGYINLHDRAERAIWWKDFWERATGGDKNSHITSVDELLKRHTNFHGLPLWLTKK